MPFSLFFFIFFSPFLLRRGSIVAGELPLLRRGFYDEICPKAEQIVRDTIRRAMGREPRSAASVMRLQFHDCFVNGCDGSVLLDDTESMIGEKMALSNINSLRSFEVIDEAKDELERVCPGIVSCADLIIMSARDAVFLSKGPNWEVKLGRKDSLIASRSASDDIMPSPRANATFLVNLFRQFNLSTTDLVALSGSHSIGMARCFSILFRLYNQSGSGLPDPHMDPNYRSHLDRLCPSTGDPNITGKLDSTPVLFDNQYFKDLTMYRGFLNSDQTLFSGDQKTRILVKKYSFDQIAFFDDFVNGMLKLGDLQIEQPGEIRKNCRVVNSQFKEVRFTSEA